MARAQTQWEYLRFLIDCIGLFQAFRVRLSMIASRLRLMNFETTWLRHPKLERKVLARLASTDFVVFRQVLMEEQYSVVGNIAPEIIVDCGANVGYTSAYFLTLFPKCRVIAIEPLRSNFDICRSNLAYYGSRAKVVHAAVWSHCGRLTTDHKAGNEWGFDVRSARPGETADIPAIDLPSLGLERIDLLKIDIECSEIELFSHGADRWLPTVRNIVIELHNDECAHAFFHALDDYSCDTHNSGELTICCNIRPKDQLTAPTDSQTPSESDRCA